MQAIGIVRAQPCVGPAGAVHMVAGHNDSANRVSINSPAFDNAMAQVGCPDRWIRLVLPCVDGWHEASRIGNTPRGRASPQEEARKKGEGEP